MSSVRDREKLTCELKYLAIHHEHSFQGLGLLAQDYYWVKGSMDLIISFMSERKMNLSLCVILHHSEKPEQSQNWGLSEKAPILVLLSDVSF